MASSYKYFDEHDRVVVNNELDQIIQNEKGSDWTSTSSAPHYFLQVASGNVDFPLAVRVFDVTYGRSSEASESDSPDISAQHNIYNQFAKVLLGHESDGSIKKFNLKPQDTSGAKILHNALFVNFARSQVADKIRQGSFDLIINASGSEEVHLKDSGSLIRECATGYYGLLYASSSNISDFNIVPDQNDVQGMVFYEAGVAVVSPYIFSKSGSYANPSSSNQYIAENELGILVGAADSVSSSYDIAYLAATGSIRNISDGLTANTLTASYQSTTELNSTIYFCRAYNHEFNYSSNPTYLNNSKIVVKGDNPEALPRTYITTVGLYSDDNQLLAVAKLSEPVLKTPENELIVRTRLDF